MTMPIAVYEENNGVFPCPKCEGDFRRVWSGQNIAPSIKTIERLEDRWRKQGLLDPEDPEYARRNQERVRAMREDNKKRLERMLEQNEAVISKHASVDNDADLEPTTKEDLEKLPPQAIDKKTMTKDGDIKDKE
jgi:hypothetical protein